MQFKLTNMGRIRTADVTLNGITVIAGPNGSGKSTISRALFTWFTLLRQIRDELSQERMKSIANDIETSLIEVGVSDYAASRFLPIYFRNRSFTKLADRSFWMDEVESRGWWMRHCSQTCSHLSSSGEDIHHVVDRFYEKIKQRALYWLDKDEMEIAQFVVTRYFAKAFDEQVGTYFDERATTEVSLGSDDGVEQASRFYAGVASALVGVGHVNRAVFKGMRMFYLEPAHMLDDVPTQGRRVGRKSAENRYSVNMNVRWSRILRQDLRRQDMSLQQVERLEPIRAELDKIVSTIHGEIDTAEQKLVFRDTDLPRDKPVSLMNIASGAKSMAAILRGLRNDSIHPGDFIIIDEPESNLHPEWQLSFAKFLVLLHAKFNMRILLNTHSPDFLKAIEVYADLLDQKSDCSYYNMVSENRRQYDTKDVGGNLEEVFRSMGEPFIRLMHGEHYEQTVC